MSNMLIKSGLHLNIMYTYVSMQSKIFRVHVHIDKNIVGYKPCNSCISHLHELMCIEKLITSTSVN